MCDWCMAPGPTPRTTAASDLRSAISRLIYASCLATTAPASCAARTAIGISSWNPDQYGTWTLTCWRCTRQSPSAMPRSCIEGPASTATTTRARPACDEDLRRRPHPLPPRRAHISREFAQELMVRIRLPPADSPSLSGFRVRSRKSPGFQPLCGPFRAAVVDRDAQSPAASGRTALVSLSGHIPVPQCCGCGSRYRPLAASKVGCLGGSDLGGALSSDRLKQSRAGSVDLARRAADVIAPAACLRSSRVAGARQEWLG